MTAGTMQDIGDLLKGGFGLLSLMMLPQADKLVLEAWCAHKRGTPVGFLSIFISVYYVHTQCH